MQDLREAVAHVGRIDAVEQSNRRQDDRAHAQADAQSQPHGVVRNRCGPELPVHGSSRRGVEQHGQCAERRGQQQRRRLQEEAARRHARQGHERELEGECHSRAHRVNRDQQGRGGDQEGEHAGDGIRTREEASGAGLRALIVSVPGGGGPGLVRGISGGRAARPDLPEVDDALAHRGHERGVVRDRHQGDAALEGGAQEAHEAEPRAAVLAEGRLVEDEQLGGADERGRHRQAALLAARQGHGVGAREGGEPQGLEVFVDEGGDLLLAHSGRARADRELLGDGGGQELVFGLLEDHGHAPQELFARPLVRIAARTVGGLDLNGALQWRQEAREGERKS